MNGSSRRAFLELLCAASTWSAFERYTTGTLTFEVDLTSNMVFACGRAEHTISEFCRSSDGRKIGISLAVSETFCEGDQTLELPSVRSNMKSWKRLFRKRTSSALNSMSRVLRLFGGAEVQMCLQKKQL